MSVTAAFLILKKRLVEEEEKETSFRIDEWSVRTKGKIQFDSVSFRFIVCHFFKEIDPFFNL